MMGGDYPTGRATIKQGEPRNENKPLLTTLPKIMRRKLSGEVSVRITMDTWFKRR